VTLLLGGLNFFYIGLAVLGLIHAIYRKGHNAAQMQWNLALLIAFIVIRTAFLTTVETPEPRYVLECFPAVLALGALAWLPPSS
jgi:hypothetical protein